MPEIQERPQTAFDYAVSLAGGNAAALARIAGVTPQAVSQWKQRGIVPPESAKRIAKVFGVPRDRLNPIFGK